MVVEARMRELDQGHPVVLRSEPDVDATRVVAIRVVPKVAVEMPGDGEVTGWLPGEDDAPVTLAAVRPELVPAATHAGLEDEGGHGCAIDVVLWMPPSAHLGGEDGERAIDADTDADRGAHNTRIPRAGVAGASSARLLDRRVSLTSGSFCSTRQFGAPTDGRAQWC